MPKKAAIFTLGCRTNQYDSLIIAQSLMEAGFEIVDYEDIADLYVINTCTVTHRGDADSRKAARSVLKRNPDAFIVIAGCYAQWAGESLREIKGVDLILSNREKFDIARYLPEKLKKSETAEVIVSDPTFDKSFGEAVALPLERSRALLKIQDGCDRKCSYCIVPKVRGKPRSLPKHDVLTRIGELISSGFCEVVLTGVNLGLWGKDINDSLAAVVRDIRNLDGNFRIRLSSIEPMELNDELIGAILESNRIARHLHIPIQSASDRILTEMGRPYTVNDIEKILTRIKSQDEGWNIGSDLIIGYPGETENDFNEQMRNLEKLPIDYFHIFTYSPREDTPAWKKRNTVKQPEIKSRLAVLKSFDKDRRKKFIESQIGKSLMFIIEKTQPIKHDTIMGMSDNYIRARIDGIEIPFQGFTVAKLAAMENQTPVAIPD